MAAPYGRRHPGFRPLPAISGLRDRAQPRWQLVRAGRPDGGAHRRGLCAGKPGGDDARVFRADPGDVDGPVEGIFPRLRPHLGSRSRAGRDAQRDPDPRPRQRGVFRTYLHRALPRPATAGGGGSDRARRARHGSHHRRTKAGGHAVAPPRQPLRGPVGTERDLADRHTGARQRPPLWPFEHGQRHRLRRAANARLPRLPAQNRGAVGG